MKKSNFIQKGNNWLQGNIDGYKIYAKVYPKPSYYGINNGRISKLTITDEYNNIYASYDRGWDTKPSQEFKETYQKIIEELETRLDNEIKIQNMSY